MPSYSVVLRVEKTYEVDADSEAQAITIARDRMANAVQPATEEESDEPSVDELGD